MRTDTLALPNCDFDSGRPTKAAEYSLTDDTYAKLLDRLSGRKFDLTSRQLRANLLEFYSDLPRDLQPVTSAWARTSRARVTRGKPPGRLVRAAGGYTAFVPDPLPPEIAWTPTLVRVLSDADRLIGRLAGEAGRLPNPHLLIRPFVRREAVLSSRIEGTRATLGELLAAEAGAALDRSPSDLKEVANYVAALEYGVKRLRTLPLSLRLTRELHAKLMAGVRGDSATPGEFRRTQNWIGPPGAALANATYVPPPPDTLMECMGAWEKFLHDRSLPVLIQAALMHVQFEAIHPFLDGNGRVGRLLITLFMVEREVLPTPLLYLSAFFEANRAEYEKIRPIRRTRISTAWRASRRTRWVEPSASMR